MTPQEIRDEEARIKKATFACEKSTDRTLNWTLGINILTLLFIIVLLATLWGTP